MKKSSRFMPKYLPGKPSLLAMLVAVAIAVAIAILYTTFFLVFAGLLIATIIWGYLKKPKINKHFSSMYDSRRSLSICDFAKEFDCKNVDTWVIRAVYEQTQNYLPFDKAIPIKGKDNLKDDFLLDDDDIDLDLVEEISQRTGRTLDDHESNPYYGKVKTVKDLVLFFNSQQKENAT